MTIYLSRIHYLSTALCTPVPRGLMQIQSLLFPPFPAYSGARPTFDHYVLRRDSQGGRQAKIGNKAVRADNASVPVTLWDMRIQSDHPLEDRTTAFKGFRLFGRRMFLKSINSDCTDILYEEFGSDRSELPCRSGWQVE